MDSDNLITCDFVCSGVPSPKAWRLYVAELEKKSGKLAGYDHRPKTFKGDPATKAPDLAIFASGKTEQGTFLTRSWKRAFGGRWDLRPTCHDCPFHNVKRVADITIGDFWGLDPRPDFATDDPVSLVLFNGRNHKTDILRNAFSEQCDTAQFDASVACNEKQPRLNASSQENALRGFFFDQLASRGYVGAIKTTALRAGVRKVAKIPAQLHQRCYEDAVCDLSGKGISNRLINAKGSCYGCGACASACPTGAISLFEDMEGFEYPAIDEGKCIDCGLCERVCARRPENELEMAMADVCFAAKSKDDEILHASSSGGVFWTFASEVLRRDGVVYGAAYDDGFSLRHVRCETLDQCKKCQKSKYSQSSTETIFPEVADDLRKGRLTLFAGTPCQVAAIKCYLAQT